RSDRDAEPIARAVEVYLHWRPVVRDDEREVRPEAIAGTADEGDRLALRDGVADLHGERIEDEIEVLRLPAVAVIDEDGVGGIGAAGVVAVAGAVGDEFDGPAGRRQNPVDAFVLS